MGHPAQAKEGLNGAPGGNHIVALTVNHVMASDGGVALSLPRSRATFCFVTTFCFVMRLTPSLSQVLPGAPS